MAGPVYRPAVAGGKQVSDLLEHLNSRTVEQQMPAPDPNMLVSPASPQLFNCSNDQLF